MVALITNISTGSALRTCPTQSSLFEAPAGGAADCTVLVWGTVASITGRIVTNERALSRLVHGALELLAPDIRLEPQEALRRVEIRHGQIGSGYGRETPAAREATSLFRERGLELDPTYTSKAAADFVAALRAGRDALFWHTLSAVEPELRRGEDQLVQELPERFRSLLQAAA